MEILVKIIMDSVLLSLEVVLIIVVPIVLLAMALHFINMEANKRGAKLGGSLYTLIVTWPSVAFHELSHAFFCILFGHKIRKISFWGSAEKLGYIVHTYNTFSPWMNIGNLFISIGPTLLGSISLYTLGAIIMPIEFDSFKQIIYSPGMLFTKQGFAQLLYQLFNAAKSFCSNLCNGDWVRCAFYFCLFFVIGSAMRLSRKDVVTTIDGTKALYIFVLLVTVIGKTIAYYGHPIPLPFLKLSMHFYSFALPAVVLSILSTLFYY